MAGKPLPGFRDFYPTEFAERAYIVNVWRDVARRYAFVEYDGPPLEPLELYTRKSGDEIVGQLYNFADKGDRQVALRPEMTPTFARMVAERANALRKPVRWFSVPQLFRYERQQKGRLREHFQLNVDIVGEPDVTADAELLAVAVDIMRGYGLTPGDVVARVSDRRLLAALLRAAGATDEQMPAIYAVIDKIERTPRDASLEKLRATGLTADAVGAIVETIDRSDLDAIEDAYAAFPEVAERAADLRRYFAALKELGVSDWARLDLKIVRGLAYYTGIVFEIFDAQGEFRAVCGGGRYDTLLAALGGVDLPALGFGMGDVVLGELLRARGLMPNAAATIDFWVAADDAELLPMVRSTATLLRRLGYSVEYALRDQAMGKQLKAAGSAGTRVAVLLKRETIARSGEVTLRRLADGAEESLPMESWLEQLTAELRAGQASGAPSSNGAVDHG